LIVMHVYFYEAFEEEAEALRHQLGTTLSYELTSETIQESGDAEPPARLISIRTQSIIPAQWTGAIDGVLSRSTGFDHLVAYRKTLEKPIPCGYLDEYATRAVAEHAVVTLAALFRRIPKQQGQFRQFDRDGLTGTEFGGKNLLVIGVGRIGSEIVRLARGMGMNVQGIDLVERFPDVTYVDRETGMAWADAIICAMNLTAENRGYFQYDFLRTAKRGTFFVNIARGDIARTGDLVRLLREGYLAGVALDVFEREPEVAQSIRSGELAQAALEVEELLGFPNVILTPHNAFNTLEAVQRKAEFTVRQVRQFLEHGDFLWKI